MAVASRSGDTSDDRSSAWKAYLGKLPSFLIAALVLITLTLSLIAWRLRPTSAGPPLPPAGTLLFSFTLTPHAISHPQVTELLSLSHSGTSQLDIEVRGVVSHVRSIHWQVLAIDGLGVPGFAGYLCPLYANGVKVSHGNLVKGGGPTTAFTAFRGQTSRAYVSQGGDIVHAEFCWSHDSPGIVKGSYLAAIIPSIQFINVLAKLDLSRVVSFGRMSSPTALAQYELQAGTPPTNISPGAWTWNDRLRNVGSTIPLSISAISLSGVQRDNQNAFLSGVLFGVAGGAVIAIVQELLDPIRRTKKIHEATGQQGSAVDAS